jgi:hypothetical protein
LSDSGEVERLHRLREQAAIFAEIAGAGGTELHRQQELRRRYPDDVVRAALTLDELRGRAAAKFSRAVEMWFDRQGLEQATAEPVARHKARRFESTVNSAVNSAGRLVWDLCCGIGADAIALAEHGPVIAVDRNPAACLRTEWNAAVYGVADRVQTRATDVESLLDELAASGWPVHIDPDRRPGLKRTLRVEDMAPGLDFLEKLFAAVPGGAVKLSPAANFPGKFPEAEIELVSLDGECKEATVWFGSLGEPGLWRATVLPAGVTLSGDPLANWAEVGPLGPYLFDPDPAVVRAGLVSLLAETLGLRRLDEADEYLTGDEPTASPFVRRYRVLADLPNNDRAIRQHVREAGYGRAEIKCRHVPVQAEIIRRKLPLGDGEPVSLVYAKVAGKTRVIAARRDSELA